MSEPLLSIVVPTKNERGNVAALLERLEVVLPTVAMEIIFVDASTRRHGARRSRRWPGGAAEIVLLRQGPDRRARRPRAGPWCRACGCARRPGSA